MTMTNASPSFKRTGGRRATRFTPQAIEKIKEYVAKGVNRQDIANLLDVTVGTLQVTCSKLGISLRQNGSARHTLDGRGRIIPIPSSVSIAHVRQQKTEEVSQTVVPTASLARFAITMRRGDKEIATDIPLTSGAIARVALKGTVRDLGIADLLGEVVVAAIKRNMIQKILPVQASPFEP